MFALRRKYQSFIFSSSQQGISHRNSNIENQDSVKVFIKDDFYVLAVADGHGAKQHFRSKAGSSIAVDTCVEVLKRYYDLNLFGKSKRSILAASEKAKKEIISTWRERVKTDIEKNDMSFKKSGSFFSTNYLGVDRILDTHAYERVSKDPVVAYGTTLTGVISVGKGVLIIKIGDGEVRGTFKSKVVNPFESMSLLPKNKTHSLCEKAAIESFYSFYFKKHPQTLVVSSDGVINSFSNENVFNDIGPMIKRKMKTNLENIQAILDEMNYSFANKGSLDDSSMCCVIKEKI